MKKRILTLGMVLALVSVLVMPTAALATTTDVIGDVVEGYTFTAPTAIPLGSMTPGTPATGSSTDGSLVGNDPDGYTVTGIDAKGTDKGYMVSVATFVLANLHQISNEDANYVKADTAKTFVDTSGPTNVAVSLYVIQDVSYADTVASAYSITITFTVVPKTP